MRGSASRTSVLPSPLVARAVGPALLLTLLAGFLLAFAALHGGSRDAASQVRGNPAIVATYGVGGVLKSDGVLYQWRPEKKRWVNLDESFRLDGEKRKLMPLPVRPSEVARMEGFGFLVTRTGSCWLYNLDSNQWENIGRP